MFVSPLTGELGESYRWQTAFTMLHAGYDSNTGKSQKRYVTVTQTGVEIRTHALLRLRQGRLIYQKWEHGRGVPSIVLQVKICVLCKCSLTHTDILEDPGAVFGSKLMKTMQVTGDLPMPIPNFGLFQDLLQTVQTGNRNRSNGKIS